MPEYWRLKVEKLLAEVLRANDEFDVETACNIAIEGLSNLASLEGYID